jgi:hypothetical protein
MTITHDRGTKHQSSFLLISLITTATISGIALGIGGFRQAKLNDLRSAEIGFQQACRIKLTNETIITNAAEEAERSTRLLKAIPNLPGFGYPEAQRLLATYDSCTKRVQATQGLFQARSLINQSPKINQTTVLPVAQWKPIQANLSKAVQQLQAVPKDSPIANQAKQELAVAQTKLALVNQRLQAEEEANNAVNKAEGLYRSAEQSLRNSGDLDNLLSVQRTYNDAIQALKTVPQHTTVYDRAQQNISLYTTQLRNVEARYARQFLQPLVKELTQFSNSLETKMEYELYVQKFNDLKMRFEDNTRSEAIRKHPSYAALEKAMADFDNALTVWTYCHSGSCYNSLSTWRLDFRQNIEWLPGDYSLQGKLLTEQYPGMEISSNIWGQRYIELNKALTKIWESSDRQLKEARQKLS